MHSIVEDQMHIIKVTCRATVHFLLNNSVVVGKSVPCIALLAIAFISCVATSDISI